MIRARRKASGYTLIEILIVLFIISIVTTVALLSIGNNDNRQMKSIATELTQILALAEQQAMLSPSVLGLTVHAQALQFSTLSVAANGKENTWLPLQDTILKSYNVPGNIQISVNVGDDIELKDKKKDHPQIVISTNGDMTPFTIYVGKKGEKPHYAIVGDADGSLTNKLLS